MRCCDAILFHLVQAFLSASSMARFRISSSACDFVNSGLSPLAKGSLRARPTPSVNCIEVGTPLFLQSHTHLDSLPALCGCSRIDIFLAVSGGGGVTCTVRQRCEVSRLNTARVCLGCDSGGSGCPEAWRSQEVLLP